MCVKFIRLTTLALLLILLEGCVNPEQLAWHKELGIITWLANDLAELDTPIPTLEIRRILTNPDHDTEVGALGNWFGETEYSDFVTKHLWTLYRRNKLQAVSKRGGDGTEAKDEILLSSFRSSRVWFYDEARRFSSPYSCDAFGFLVYWFIIENDVVMAGGGLHSEGRFDTHLAQGDKQNKSQ